MSPLNAGVAGHDSETPGVSFSDLALGKYVYEPDPQNLLRKTRRVFQRVRLEAFVEDRTFGPYRGETEQELRSLHKEAEETRREARAAAQCMGTLAEWMRAGLADPSEQNAGVVEASEKDRLAAEEWFRSGMPTQRESAIEQVMRIHATLRRVEALGVATSIFGNKSFVGRLLEELRSVHFDVQREWGTWPRRVKPAASAFAAALGIGSCLYVYASLLTGSMLWLALVLFAAACSAAHTYYSGRAVQVRKIEAKTRGLAAFDPEPAAGGDAPRPSVLGKLKSGTIWNTSDPERLSNETYSHVVVGAPAPAVVANYKAPDVSVHPGSFGIYSSVAALAIVLLPPVILLLGGIPTSTDDLRMSVEVEARQGPCSAAEGFVVWSGPVEVVILTGDGISAVRRGQVVRVSRGRQRSEPCNGGAPAEGMPLTIVSNMGTAAKGVLVVPFATPVPKIDCRLDSGKDGIRVPAPMAGALRQLGEALRKCPGTPEIDVRGFASGLEFSCGAGSALRNLELAELRRRNVLVAMFGEAVLPVTPAGALTMDEVSIVQPTLRRWTTLEHMNELSTVGQFWSRSATGRSGAACRSVVQST